MRSEQISTMLILAIALTLVGGLAFSAWDKHTVKVPNWLSFSQFGGYEAWQLASFNQQSMDAGGPNLGLLASQYIHWI